MMSSHFVNVFLRSVTVAVVLVLGACASTPGPRVSPSDYSSVRVAGAVERDFARAVEHLQGEQYQEAVALLQSVVEREQRLPAPFVNLGIAYHLSGNEKDAEESLLHALRIESGHSVASSELGALYRRQGRFDDAREIYTRGLHHNPTNLPLIRNLGILCDLYLQEPGCALAQFTRYLELAPDDKEVAIWVADLKRR